MGPAVRSLLQAGENAALVQRIEALSADTRPQWGKLSCGAMLAHCQCPFQVAAGALKLKRGLIGLLFGGWAKKKFITSDAPFNHDSPTDPRFLGHDASDFDLERSKLVAQVKAFGDNGALTRDSHPFFGPLNPEEWDRLLWKHLDHHLRQFGV